MNEPKPSAAEAFIEKLKTLQFSTGKALPPCPVCGKGVGGHKPAGFVVRIEMRRSRQEMAFSA